jgi:hypothetical protein
MRKVLRYMAGPASGVVGLIALAAPASAADPQAADESPVGGTHAHRHVVMTGNGGCVDIDQVYFEPAGRGLHRAANESGPTQGPWHVFPGLGCEDLGF